MSLYISLLNNMAVSFFGGILSASFCKTYLSVGGASSIGHCSLDVDRKIAVVCFFCTGGILVL